MARADVYSSSSVPCYHHSRNINCIQCSAPGPRSGGAPSAPHASSPRFAGANLGAVPNQMLTVQQQQLGAATAALATMTPSPGTVGKLAPMQTRQLTPSGRAFAVGGRMQNISHDPLAPCVMFWPDNEALPEPGQIRPLGIVSTQQPPIMNTGNKGPIEQQPGDWVCQKCEYLNWRRRKVCQTCFPYAEGNGDSVSATMHAERLALLEATLIQNAALQIQQQQQLMGRSQQQQQQLQQRLSVTQRFAQPNFTPPTSAPAQLNAPNRNAPSARAPFVPRRSGSTPEPSAGNIVYQTPPSPASARQAFPSLAQLANALPRQTQVPGSMRARFASLPAAPSAQAQTQMQTGPLLPSFLAHELVPPPHSAGSLGTRTPASLSPASSSSVDLSADEHELAQYNELYKSGVPRLAPGTIARPAFYAQAHRAGSASGSSSSATGSTSSLTLGGSIWSLDQSEGKAWPGAFGAPGDRRGLSRPASTEKLAGL